MRRLAYCDGEQMIEQIVGIINDKCVVVEHDDFGAYVNELFANHFGRRIVLAVSAECIPLDEELLKKLKAINAEIFIHSSEPISIHSFLSLDHKEAISPKEKQKPFWANDWRKKHKR